MRTASPPFMIVALLVGTGLLAQTGGQIQYTKEGSLALPRDYAEWIFLSSGYATAYTEGPNAGLPLFHNVFVNPASYRSFMKTGTWPDKTVLVLELRKSETKLSINKQGQVQTDIAAIEVHVKDSSRGGWAFYGFDGKGQGGKPFPKTADCFTCHEQNGAVDTTFVQFYPTLIPVAKQHGTFKKTGD
jgi:hypothetical protein